MLGLCSEIMTRNGVNAAVILLPNNELCCRIFESPMLAEVGRVMKALKTGATKAELLQLQQSVELDLLNSTQ